MLATLVLCPDGGRCGATSHHPDSLTLRTCQLRAGHQSVPPLRQLAAPVAHDDAMDVTGRATVRDLNAPGRLTIRQGATVHRAHAVSHVVIHSGATVTDISSDALISCAPDVALTISTPGQVLQVVTWLPHKVSKESSWAYPEDSTFFVASGPVAMLDEDAPAVTRLARPRALALLPRDSPLRVDARNTEVHTLLEEQFGADTDDWSQAAVMLALALSPNP